MDKARIRTGFVTANPEIIAKLDILRNEYGVSLNGFFVKAIAEKLSDLGYGFNDKSFRKKDVRKPTPRQKASDMDKLIMSLQKIQMRKR